MWFDKRRQPVTEQTPEEPQHWPAERMINEGHAEYATKEDLESLGFSELAEIARICEAPEFAPDECIPCLAHVMYLEKETPEPDPDGDDDAEEPQIIPELYERAQKVLHEDYPEHAQENRHAREMRHADPYKEIERTVNYLAKLMGEVNGPPRARDLTEVELALLTLGAARWVKMTDAQGVALREEQQQMLDATRDLVARLQN